ncbi:MAG: mechanosensitive ion channel family protein [Myxococcota bacterium]|nr:mechanosensitive ion channel family protein [Myxococcota bacterium]
MDFLGYDLFFGNTVGDVVMFIFAIIIAFIAAKLAQIAITGKVKRWAETSETNLDDMLLDTFEKPIYWIVIAGGIGVSLGILEMPKGMEKLSSHVVTFVVLFFVAWSASNLVSSFRRLYLDPFAEKTESKLDDQIIPIVEKAAKIAIWIFAMLVAFDNIGFDVYSLLTGLGIGGLAFAMAAKETLANIFGSLTIFADRPFQVGDIISLKGYTGVVTDLGIRTIRLRTVGNTVVTVPNSLLVGDMVENVTANGGRRHMMTVGVTYDTTAEELEAIIQRIRVILTENENVGDDMVVGLGNFGASALEISVWFTVIPAEVYVGCVGAVNLEIKRSFDDNGWEMAFPTMTVYRK